MLTPIGTPRIAELAKGQESAAIIVDDLSRPTPASKIIPFLLRELTAAGVPKSEIRFVVGVAPAQPGEAFGLRLDGGHLLKGTVVLSDRPWAFSAMLTSLNDGVLHVEMEGTGERWKTGVWLSAYGLEEERCKRIGAALGQTVSRLFPGQE